MDNKQALKQYYKEIQKSLRCSPKAKKMILQNLQSNICEFLELHPNATIHDVQAEFGHPCSYAEEYVASLNNSEVYQTVAKHRFRNIVWLFCGIAVVAIIAALAIGIAIRNSNGAVQYYSEDISGIVVDTTN